LVLDFGEVSKFLKKAPAKISVVRRKIALEQIWRNTKVGCVFPWGKPRFHVS
jgi:hypothetical protein